MENQTRRLVETVKAQIAKSFAERDLRTDLDCCQACLSSSRSSLYHEIKQPGEVWEPILRSLANFHLNDYFTAIHRAASSCESPIEELLLLAMIHEAGMEVHRVSFDGSEFKPFESWACASIRPQVQFGHYRVDFVVSVGGRWLAPSDPEPVGKRKIERWRQASVIVETDGHDFHERTKEQASRDKKRDRDLQRAGFVVLRFTGSDVWRAPFDAAREVIKTAGDLAIKGAPVVTREVELRPDPWDKDR